MLRYILDWASRRGETPPDSQSYLKSAKAGGVLALLIDAVVCAIMGLVYLAVGKEGVALTLFAAIPYNLILVVSFRQGWLSWPLFASGGLLLAFAYPIVLTVLLGGVSTASGMYLWSLALVVVILALAGLAAALAALFGLALAYTVTAPLAATMQAAPLPSWLDLSLLGVNALSLFVFVLVLFDAFLRDRAHAFALARAEHANAESLLRAILPDSIAAELRDRGGVTSTASARASVVRYHAEASVLFADLVDFTGLSQELDPVELVQLLNEVFGCLDECAEREGLEKIKTIGDCYMAVAGLPSPCLDTAGVVVRFALSVQELFSRRTFGGRRLQWRIGIATGPVMAGVIGDKRFLYDVWGETVNRASRLESHGTPGQIHVDEATWQAVATRQTGTPLGPRHLKGLGPVSAWSIVP